MPNWTWEDLTQDLELLKAFLQLRDPLDSLRFGAPGTDYRNPTESEVKTRAVAFMMAAMRLSQDEHECIELMQLIHQKREAALIQLGYIQAGGARHTESLVESLLPALGRFAFAYPLPFSGLVGLIFFGVSGIVASLIVQPPFVPAVQSYIFAASFLATINRLFMPLRASTWLRAFAWMSLPTLAWACLPKITTTSPISHVLSPGAIPLVPWALALLGVSLSLKLIRSEARGTGLADTLAYFDPAISSQYVVSDSLALPSKRSVVPVRREKPIRRPLIGLATLLSAFLVLGGFGFALWIAAMGVTDKQAAIDAAAAANKKKDLDDAIETKAKADAAQSNQALSDKDKQIEQLREDKQKLEEEGRKKDEEIKRLNATESASLEGANIYFLSPDQSSNPLDAQSLMHIDASGKWEMLASRRANGGIQRLMISGRYTKVNGQLALLPDDVGTDEEVSSQGSQSANELARKNSFRLSGDPYFVHRPGRFNSISVTSDAGDVSKAFRWHPSRVGPPDDGTYVALNPSVGSSVRIAIRGDRATVGVTPSGATLEAKVNYREDGYVKLEADDKDLPSYVVWDKKERRLFLFLGDELEDEPFVLAFQKEADFVKHGR